MSEPVVYFRILCLRCFTPDRVESASVDGKTIRVCRECGTVAVESEAVNG